jgi:hypothetical protein
MWSLTSEDVRLVRDSASRRRAEIEERYHEELRALDVNHLYVRPEDRQPIDLVAPAQQCEKVEL